MGDPPCHHHQVSICDGHSGPNLAILLDINELQLFGHM